MTSSEILSNDTSFIPVFVLRNGLKKKVLNEGVTANIELKGDTSGHLISFVEGFSDGKLIGSFFSYEHSKKNGNLKFDGVSTIQLREISALSFSVKQPEVSFKAGKICKLAALELIIIPLLLPALMGGNPKDAFDHYMTPFYVAAPVFYFTGDILIKRSQKKRFVLGKEWKIEKFK